MVVAVRVLVRSRVLGPWPGGPVTCDTSDSNVLFSINVYRSMQYWMMLICIDMHWQQTCACILLICKPPWQISTQVHMIFDYIYVLLPSCSTYICIYIYIYSWYLRCAAAHWPWLTRSWGQWGGNPGHGFSSERRRVPVKLVGFLWMFGFWMVLKWNLGSFLLRHWWLLRLHLYNA